MKQEGILRTAGKDNLGICDEVWHAVIRSDRKIVARIGVPLFWRRNPAIQMRLGFIFIKGLN